MIHIFVPFSTYRSPRFSARNRIDTTSDPAPLSLIASAPTAAPEISPGRYRRFCSSVPFFRIWFTHRFECAPYESPTLAEARLISSIATQCSRYPIPAPPYSSSTVTPNTPKSPIFRQRSAGKSFSRSIAAARGAISSAANAATLSRSMSALSPKSKLSGDGRLTRLADTGRFLFSSPQI